MTLLLSDDEVLQVLTMGDCMEAMELALREFTEGRAVSRPRMRYRCESPTPGARYFANVHIGGVPGAGVAAVRIDSNLRPEQLPETAEGARVQWQKESARNWGLILLYDLGTAELLCIMHDFSLSGIRVGATTGLAVRLLASPEASCVALFGTGKQARSHLEALCAVRPIERVQVFSPNADHRRAFAEEMGERLNIEILAVPTARQAVEGADIVCCTTNSATPVFDGSWLRPGQLVTSIANTDVTVQRFEVDRATFLRSDRIVVNDIESLHSNRQVELLDLVAAGDLVWDQVVELGQILTGRAPGRRSPEELIYYKSNTGMAVQFAAAGAVAYRKALAAGLGRQLPTEWFGSDLSPWYAKGYYPSS